MIFDVMLEMFENGIVEALIELGTVLMIVGAIALIILGIHDWR